MSKAKKSKDQLAYEQRLHENWMRRQEAKLKGKASPTVAYSKENLQRHWQDQAALDAQHQRELEMMRRAKVRKKRQRQQKRAIDQWIKTNNKAVDINKLAKQWENVSAKYRDKLIGLAVKYFAIVDAGVQANQAITLGLRMENAGLDIKELTSYAVKMMRVELGSILSSELPITKKQKEELISRLISTQLPLRDNKVSSGGKPASPQNVIRNAIQNELARYERE